MTLHPYAVIAARAARNRRSWGRWASMRYAVIRGVPLSIYTLACVLAEAERAGL